MNDHHFGYITKFRKWKTKHQVVAWNHLVLLWWKTSGWYPIWIMQYHQLPKAKYDKTFGNWWWSKEEYGLMFLFWFFVVFLQVMNMASFYYRQRSLYLWFFFGWALCGVLLLHGGFCWSSTKDRANVKNKYQELLRWK